MTMVSQKVVLRGTRENPEAELELGPFNQGVALKDDSFTVKLVDVASRNQRIAIWQAEIGWRAADRGAFQRYLTAFIQIYPANSPSHPPGGAVRSLLAQVEGRPIEFHLSVAHERRLRLHMEDVDAQERTSVGGDPYERDDSGAFTDATIAVAIRTAIERGLEALEAERGVVSRHDGAVFPSGVDS